MNNLRVVWTCLSLVVFSGALCAEIPIPDMIVFGETDFADAREGAVVGTVSCDGLPPLQTNAELIERDGKIYTDGDGVLDASDNGLDLVNPGQEDSDTDGVCDVCNGCPDDTGKIEPGACGCGVLESDPCPGSAEGFFRRGDTDTSGVVDRP